SIIGPSSGRPTSVRIRQGEYPQGGTCRWNLQLRRQRCERTRLARAVADCDGNILLAIDFIADRERVDGIVGADLPQHVAGLVIERIEVAIPVTTEDHSATCRQHGACHRSALAMAPDGRLVRQLDGIDAADIAVASFNRDTGEGCTSTTGIDLAR